MREPCADCLKGHIEGFATNILNPELEKAVLLHASWLLEMIQLMENVPHAVRRNE